MKLVTISYQGEDYPIWVHDNVLTPFGRFEDFITQRMLDTGTFPELPLMERFKELGRDLRYLDVGANIGVDAIFVHEVLGWDVVAFEPARDNYEVLSANCPWATKFPYALGSQVGEMEQQRGYMTLDASYLGNSGATSYHPGKGVAVTTIDELRDLDVPIHADVMKLDVENMELEVLKGARTFLMTQRPTVYAETNTAKQLYELSTWMFDEGYVITWIADVGNPMVEFKHRSNV